MNIYSKILAAQQQQQKMLVVLIDPDKYDTTYLKQLCNIFEQTHPDLLFVGGSLVSNNITNVVEQIKKHCEIPIILFPGNAMQITPAADAILLLSLISGRNPNYLIGQHVEAAPILARSGLEIIPTGYILIDGGRRTSVEYISNTQPIPHDKKDIAIATAMAGEQLGLKLIYLEAGSGAQTPIDPQMIQAVRNAIKLPIIVGGGLRNSQAINNAYQAGADIVVVGTAIENDPNTLLKLKNKVIP